MTVDSPYASKPSARPIVLPLLLIALGVTLMLANLGYISWETVRAALQFWPVIFIVLGIEALITRRVPWGALILAVILTAVFGTGGWIGSAPWLSQPPAKMVPAAPLNQNLDGATRAVVSFTVGGSSLTLRSLREPGLLARWQGAGSDEAGAASKYRVRDGVGRLELELTRGRSFPWFWHPHSGSAGGNGTPSPEITLELAAGVPMEIEARIGASDAMLDLRELQVTRFTYDAGASNSTIYLPSLAQSTHVTMRGGASNLVIIVPEHVNARITSESGLSSLSVDPIRFIQIAGGTTEYQSRGASTSAHTLDLKLRLGAANVEVR
ncbi:MAG: LiaI-LiaF-like domain-containing protein [Chloroflexota bacterium]